MEDDFLYWYRQTVKIRVYFRGNKLLKRKFLREKIRTGARTCWLEKAAKNESDSPHHFLKMQAKKASMGKHYDDSVFGNRPDPIQSRHSDN